MSRATEWAQQAAQAEVGWVGKNGKARVEFDGTLYICLYRNLDEGDALSLADFIYAMYEEPPLPGHGEDDLDKTPF